MKYKNKWMNIEISFYVPIVSKLVSRTKDNNLFGTPSYKSGGRMVIQQSAKLCCLKRLCGFESRPDFQINF